MINYEEDTDDAPDEAATEAEQGLFVQQTPDDVSVSSDGGKPPWLTEPPDKRKKAPWPRIANFSPYRIDLAGKCMARFQYRYLDKRKDTTAFAQGVGKLVHGAYSDAITRRVKAKWRALPSLASVEELLHLLNYQDVQFRSERDGFQVTGDMLKEAGQLISDEGPIDCFGAFATELPITVRYGPRGELVVGGYVDYVQVFGTPPIEVIITDWKTGFTQLPTGDELYFDPQAGTYLAWAKQRFPTASKIRFRIRNVRRHEDVWLPWSAHNQKIHENLAISRKALADSRDRTANPSAENCLYCPYREADSKHPACPEYRAMLEAERVRAQKDIGLLSTPLPELIREYRESGNAVKLFEQRKEDLKQAILEKLPDDSRQYKWANYTASKCRGKKIRHYDQVFDFANDLAEALEIPVGQILADIGQVQSTKVDALVKSIADESKAERVIRVIERHERLSLTAETLRITVSKSMW